MNRFRTTLAIAALGSLTVSAAADLEVTIENTSPGGGFFLTPFWVALHNGEFDSYDGGTLASMWPGLIDLAEEGNTAPIAAAFRTSSAGGAGGVETTILASAFADDAPVLNPGESVTLALDTGDPTVNRWFSYASMVIPSNDLFVANGNPLAHEIFDEDGDFIGPVVIEIRQANDNGSEVNDAFGGAAFSANGGKSVDEEVPIRNFFSEEGDPAYLASFVGTQTVTGVTITTPFEEGELLARITITRAGATTCPADLSCNGAVDFDDILAVLSSWGPCP